MSESPAAVSIRTHPGLIILYLTALTQGMAQALVFVLIPLVGRELKLHELTLSLPALGIDWQPREMAITALSALTSVIYSLAAPIWGRLSDRWGRRRVILIGVFGYCGGSLLFNVVAEVGFVGALTGAALYLSLCLVRVIYAILMAGLTAASTAYVADITTPAQRIAGIGKLNAAVQLGGMIGPLLTVAAVLGLLVPMYIYVVLTAIIVLFAWKLLPESAVRSVHSAPRAKLRYLDPRYRQLLLIGFIMCSMMGVVQSTLVFYFQDKLQLDTLTAASRFSIAMMISSFAMIFAQLVVVQRFGWSPLRLLQLGLPLALLSYMIMAAAVSLWQLWFAMGLFGLGMGFCLPGFAASTSITVEPTEQGAVAGITGATIGWGFLFGPLLGGFLYAQQNTLPYWCAAAVLVPLMAFAWRQR